MYPLSLKPLIMSPAGGDLSINKPWNWTCRLFRTRFTLIRHRKRDAMWHWSNNSFFFSPVCLAEDLSWRETIIKSFPENNLSHNFYKKLAHLNAPRKAHFNALWKFWSNFLRVFKFILTDYYFFSIVYSPFFLSHSKKRCNQQQSPGHQFWTDGPEVVKIRVLSLRVVYSWPSFYLSLYTQWEDRSSTLKLIITQFGFCTPCKELTMQE